MIGLKELAVPQTKEQSIDIASAYARQIKESPRLNSLANLRIKAKEQGAPDWFIKMVDVEVSVIIHRVAYLEEWPRNGDSWNFASNTMRLIYVADMMARQYINPQMMETHNTDKVDDWLQAIKKERTAKELRP